MSLLTAIPTFCGLALALNAAPMHFPPMTEEDPELIAFRVSIAKSSVGMVKMYLEQIACHYDDPEKVHAAVVSAMKYLWNVDCCLGEDEDLREKDGKKNISWAFLKALPSYFISLKGKSPLGLLSLKTYSPSIGLRWKNEPTNCNPYFLWTCSSSQCRTYALPSNDRGRPRTNCFSRFYS